MQNKVVKDVDGIMIGFATNGFIVEYSGKDDNDNYINVKLICPSIEDVHKELEIAIGCNIYDLGKN